MSQSEPTESAPVEKPESKLTPSWSTERRDWQEPIWAKPIFDAHLLAHENIPPRQEKPFHVTPVFARIEPASHQENWPDTMINDGRAESASQDSAGQKQAWADLCAAFEAKRTLCAKVTGYNKGGLLVSMEDKLQGFVPASQLVHFPRHLDTSAREAYLAQQKGTELTLQIIELEQERNRLVLSERVCVLENEQGEQLLSTLKSGDVLEGLVSNLCDFGAFVDLGGIDGLIHVSEISWQRINHPQDVLKIGQRVRVYVLSVDTIQKRIALSLKRLTADPWETIEDRYDVGQVVQGTITNIVDFGAFARIEEGLEGLIHISEMGADDIPHPSHVISEGQPVDVRILRIDGANHRLGLSLRHVQA